MKISILFLAIILSSGLLLVNIYTSLVDARSWGSNFPNSIQTARDYFKTVNPGNFFRIFSPAAQVVAALCLILFWKSGMEPRLLIAAGLVMLLLTDGFTFAYFYPRNHIMFEADILNRKDEIETAWKQWSTMNWLRSLMLVPAVVFFCTAAYKICQFKL